MVFRTCEYCGAHLEPGEACDCLEEEAAVEQSRETYARHMDDSYNQKKEEVTDVIGEEH